MFDGKSKRCYFVLIRIAQPFPCYVEVAFDSPSATLQSEGENSFRAEFFGNVVILIAY